MIKLIYGEKGDGKTKQLIDLANATKTDGIKVFIAKSDRSRSSVNIDIKFVNAHEYDLATAMGMLGFVRGMIAANHDIKYIFIDDIFDICNEDYTALLLFFDKIGAYCEKFELDMALTINLVEDEMPDFIKKYI